MQQGVGLVQLMVALTVGLFLLLGIVTIFVSMKQTFLSRQSMSAVQTSQRMAMIFLGANIRNAGFYSNPAVNSAATQFPAGGSFIAGQSIVGTGGGSGSDTLSTRFTADGANANQGCSAQLAANNVYTDVISVSGGYLTCTETNNTAGSAPVSFNMVSGLAGMNVQYGIDTTGGGSETEYLTAAQVGAQNYWPRVKTVTVTLLFNNPLSGQPGQPTTVSLTQTIPYMPGM
ncbi:MAG: PilW family protein [Rhodocyclaceae bacterium]|nr:PilW family protein [Rhodocyclaceae bacterium]